MPEALIGVLLDAGPLEWVKPLMLRLGPAPRLDRLALNPGPSWNCWRNPNPMTIAPGERTMKRFRAREEPDLSSHRAELMKQTEMRRPAPGLLGQRVC